MRYSISEVLQQVAAEKSHWDRVRKLQENQTNQGMIQILRLAFDPNIEFDLPDTDPPYKPCQAIGQEAMLYHSIRKMYVFIKSAAPHIPQKKREIMFVQMLESLTPDDAKLMLAVIRKKIPYPGVTYKTVEAAFPGLLPPSKSKKDNEQD